MKDINTITRYSKLSKFIFLLLLILFSCTNDIGNTIISFDTTTYDFGEITVDKNPSIAFGFSNTGNKPLIIENIKTSCGCTVPEWDGKRIMPNNKGEVRVNIQPFSPGSFNSSVTVFYNGKDSPQVLRIKGVVEYLSLLEE